MRFLVPQFIEVEDKIVGPLTLKQFLYIGSSVGLSLLLFFIVQPWLWLILSILMISGAAVLSLVKVNGQPFIKVIISAIGFYWRPQTYVWQEKQKSTVKSPETEKSENNLSLEKIVAGISLKRSWQNLQTGSKVVAEEGRLKARRISERYEIVHKISGDRQAARRVDYR